MSANKKPSVYFEGDPVHPYSTARDYADISKAAWADLYYDLFSQMTGRDITGKEAMEDAKNRLGILKANGIR